MKKIVFVISIIITTIAVSYGQNYQTSAGLRGAFVSGITVKHFIEPNTALEGILAGGVWGGGVTGLYEIHAQAFEVDRLYWYYGGGAHIHQWNDNFPQVESKAGSYLVLGLDGILGLEYDIEEIPITISADWKPFFNLTGFPGFWGYGGAISIRYTFPTKPGYGL